MRLFVAVVPPPAAVHHLERRVARDRGLANARLVEGIRWTLPQRWHVTLAFVSQVDRPTITAALPVLRDVLLHCSPPVLQLAGSGAFGGRILYTGVVDATTGAHSAELAALAGRTGEVLLSHGVAVEDRPFQPHLTLARSRARSELDPVLERLTDYRGPSWRATEVLLVESLLGEQPEYRTLAAAVVGPGTDATGAAVRGG